MYAAVQLKPAHVCTRSAFIRVCHTETDNHSSTTEPEEVQTSSSEITNNHRSLIDIAVVVSRVVHTTSHTRNRTARMPLNTSMAVHCRLSANICRVTMPPYRHSCASLWPTSSARCPSSTLCGPCRD